MDACALSKAQIQEFNPQRFEFEMVDRVIWTERQPPRLLAIKELRVDDWWGRGHLPGRPIMPGVLMIEAAAQVAGVGTRLAMPEFGFVGFAGVDDVKFRGKVEPPGLLYILVEPVELRPRRVVAKTQCLYQDEVVFEGTITGMAILAKDG